MTSIYFIHNLHNQIPRRHNVGRVNYGEITLLMNALMILDGNFGEFIDSYQFR